MRKKINDNFGRYCPKLPKKNESKLKKQKMIESLEELSREIKAMGPPEPWFFPF